MHAYLKGHVYKCTSLRFWAKFTLVRPHSVPQGKNSTIPKSLTFHFASILLAVWKIYFPKVYLRTLIWVRMDGSGVEFFQRARKQSITPYFELCRKGYHCLSRSGIFSSWERSRWPVWVRMNFNLHFILLIHFEHNNGLNAFLGPRCYNLHLVFRFLKMS
jgi:hypothetical protein